MQRISDDTSQTLGGIKKLPDGEWEAYVSAGTLGEKPLGKFPKEASAKWALYKWLRTHSK